MIGPRAVRLYPLFHPAAALYTPSTLETLRADFQRIPELLALGPPQQPEPGEPASSAESSRSRARARGAAGAGRAGAGGAARVCSSSACARTATR